MHSDPCLPHCVDTATGPCKTQTGSCLSIRHRWMDPGDGAGKDAGGSADFLLNADFLSAKL